MQLVSKKKLTLPLKENLSSPVYAIGTEIDFSKRSAYVLEDASSVIEAFSVVGSFVVISAVPHQLPTQSVHIGVRSCSSAQAVWFRSCLRYAPQQLDEDETVYAIMEACRNLGKACLVVDLGVVEDTIPGAMSERRLIGLVQKLRLVQNIDTLVFLGNVDGHLDLVSKLCCEFA